LVATPLDDLPLKRIVGLHAVDDEAVAGVALTVGEDVLVAEAGVGGRSR